MAFSPATLRDGAAHFLLDLAWGGHTYHLSEEAIEVTIGTDTITYTDGLRFDGSWEDRLDLFASTPSSRSVSLDLYLDDLVDVPKRIKAGHPLGAATGTLSMWVEGQTEARAILVGAVRGVEYGAKEEPVSLTIEEAPMMAPGLIPGPAQRVAFDGTLALQNGDLPGQYYPIIFGRPGGAAGYGSPALYHLMIPAATTGTLRICGHSTVPGDVVIVNTNTGLTETVTPAWDGVAMSAVTSTLPESAGETSSEYYVRWPAAGGAGVPSTSDPTVPMRGAGDIMAWMLDRSGARVDSGRMEVSAERLNGFRLDAAIVPGKEDRVSPIDWIQTHLAPILPVSARVGDGGLYYAVWSWGATSADAVAHLDADAIGAARVGSVEYSDPDALKQEIRLDYALDYSEDAYQSTLVYTGARDRLSLATGVVLDAYLERGFLDYAGGDLSQIRTLEISSDVVLADSTAHLVCQYLARRYGVQSRLVHYEVDPEWAWMEPGAVVTVTDSEIGLDSEVAIVESVIVTTSEQVGLGLRILGRVSL